MKILRCPICGGMPIRTINATNWKFKLETYEQSYPYSVCGECGVMFRIESDIDYTNLYVETYDNRDNIINDLLRTTSIKGKLRKLRDSYAYMGKHRVLGYFLNKKKPAAYPYLSEYKYYLSNGDSFLDVGCRKGMLILTLKSVGANVYGAEPYLDDNIVYSNGVTVEKKFLSEIDRKFNIIFYDNVFEHLDTPWNELKTIYEKLEDQGICGLAFPGYGDLIENYGKDAYIIQAPQHTFLHTEKSIRLLAQKANLKIEFIKKIPIREWYIKSYLLKHNIIFDENNQNFKSLQNLLPSEAIGIIDKQISESMLAETGDHYHVMLRKF